MTVKARRIVPVALLLLALLTVGVFAPVLTHDFVNYDDREYLLENAKVRAGLTLPGLRWALTATAAGNWHPLTWVSHMLDVELFGLSPAGHHLSSLILHLLNVLLLFLVLRGMTGAAGPSGFVAALFAVHPLHVESVAWVAERKDLLCAFFWILTLGAYRRYAARPGIPRAGWVLLFFSLGLLAKPMIVTLPAVLLLLDFWPLGRLSPSSRTVTAGASPRAQAPLARLVAEKLPLFALAAAAGGATYLAQEQGRLVKSLELYPLSVRAGNALLSYAAYVGKFLWPQKLAVFYPHPGAALPWSGAGLAAAFLLLVTTAALAGRRRRPALAAGWLWYLGTLVPVIGLVQVGEQAMADRYTYLPLIGLLLLLAWGWPDLARRLPPLRALTAPLACLAVAALALTARAQVRHWQNSVRLFEHSLAVTEENFLAENNLGAALAEAGRPAEAMAHYEAAIRLRPDHASPRVNLGTALSDQGRFAEAAARFREAIALEPHTASAWNNLGVALDRGGDPDEAIACYREALRLNPSSAQAHNNLGAALARRGDFAGAAASFREAVRLEPGYAAARENLATALRQAGSPQPP